MLVADREAAKGPSWSSSHAVTQ